MQKSSIIRIGDKVVRKPRTKEFETEIIQESFSNTSVRSRRFESPLLIIYIFGFIISLGTLFLWLPISNNSDEFTPFITALFTSTSAATLTGLVTVNTSEYWSFFGEITIAILMFLGGATFMSAATFLLVVFAQQFTSSNQLVLWENQPIKEMIGSSNILRITIQVAALGLIIQIAAAIFYYYRFINLFQSNGEVIWQSIFLSISSYNNGGFTIIPDSSSLTVFFQDHITLLFIAFMIFLGSLSYPVILELLKFKRFKRLSLDTKLVLVTTISLVILGTLFFLVTESGNSATFKDQNFIERIGTSLFQSISGRTAGFSSVDFSSTREYTNILYAGLMFIGGASGSVAGGIKVTTFAVIVLAIMTASRGKTYVEAYGREIPNSLVVRAFSLSFIAIIFIFTIAFLLVITENITYSKVLFEVISAFGTVGLSTGITSSLSDIGQLLIIFTMFIGRVGPLTIALALGRSRYTALYRYSEERIRIG
ncbi:MAG: Trk family potassium uptake protein [SAR202 cluster bacterium]|nr:Trk family potassium uptake protein [Chloroflexota bacterium]MQG51765.1 Trk family potassium uptake protein [SAR202 cluster bacterium]|tara:strand:+ start:1630 stop:3075 length:1446 start_codon:yes stop_codon:yes gene_type:complete